MSYLEEFRQNLETLFAAYSEATGLPVTKVSKLISGYRSYFVDMRTHDFCVGTYDRIVGRFSSVWPHDIPWPEDIRRIQSAALPDGAEAPDEEALAERRKVRDWLSDIPSQETNV